MCFFICLTARLLRISSKFLTEEYNLSHGTVSKYMGIVDEVLSLYWTTFDRVATIGDIVEVDETLLGKRKYHRGKRLKNNTWVFGLTLSSASARKGPRPRIFVPVADRSAATLRQHIMTFVHPGAEVRSDKWKGYREEDLRALDMSHKTVNHSLHFKDPHTGVHTNTIEGANAVLKKERKKQVRGENALRRDIFALNWLNGHKGHLWKDALVAVQHYNFTRLRAAAARRQ